MQKYTGSVFRKFDSAVSGNIGVNVQVTVRDAVTNALATLYGTNNTSSTPLANPLTTDVNGQYSFYAANGRYNISFSAAGTPSINDVQLFDFTEGTGAGEFITLEQFNASAGIGNDDTAAWEAACAESFATGRGIQLLNKTYLITPRTPAQGNYTFKSFLRGMSDTLVKAYTSPVRIDQGSGNYTWQRLLPLTVSNVMISDFKVDGNISADPVDWATGYNSFTGSRGLVLESSNNTRVENVRTQNTMWAGIAHYNCQNTVVRNCHTTRCRGNFGDGFYMWGRNFVYEACTTSDVTRIGFVVETNAGSTYISRNGKFIACKAENGHDNSGLYGGVEGNYGFWFENCVSVDAENCESRDFLTGGFNTVPSYIAGTEASVADMRYGTFVLTNCYVYNSRYGVVCNCINEDLWNRTHIIGGGLYNVNTGIYVGTNSLFSPQTYVYITGLDIRLSVHNISTRAVMQLSGNVVIEGMEVIFDEGFDQTMWDLGYDVNGYSTFGAFGLDSGYRFYAKDVRCWKEIGGVKTDIGVRTKFANSVTREFLSVELERCNISQEGNITREMVYRNCNFLLFGSDVVKEKLVYDGCKFTARRTTGSEQVVSAYSTVRDILFRDCVFLFNAPNDFLYIYNQERNTTAPIARIQGCRFIRDFAANGPVIKFDADPAFKVANVGIFNMEISNCTFENTGGSTSNAILLSGFDAVDLASVFGTGNYKSPTLTVDASGPIASYF